MKGLKLSLVSVFAIAACSANDTTTGSPAVDESHKTPPKFPVVQVVRQTNLVSDQEGVAKVQDPNLVNAWGLAFNPAGFAWVADNGTGVSTVYDANGQLKLTVTIPAPPPCNSSSSSATSTPTGTAFNTDTAFFKKDLFVFVTEDGTIAGWQPSFGNTAVLRVDNSAAAAVYKGLTLAVLHDDPAPDADGADAGADAGGDAGADADAGKVVTTRRIYATNFLAGRIDAFDSDYKAIRTEGGFVDPDLPSGYAPFNIEQFPQGIVVTYALQSADRRDDVAGPGNGFVDLFDERGIFLQRLISNGELNAPWGLAIAPSDFGAVSGDLLVGNFGDGRINAYSLQSCSKGATFIGTLGKNSTEPLVIDGLWSIEFGPGAGGFATNKLYFTAGPGDEEHGLFGSLEKPRVFRAAIDLMNK